MEVKAKDTSQAGKKTGSGVPAVDVQVQKQIQNSLQRKASLVSNSSRGKWGNKWEFLLSCVGLSVGIGNVWRFPYLAYENGGGAFLVPYLVMLLLAGKPMYFMELAMGQFGGGPVTFWRCAPILKGVGAAMVLGSAVVSIYYNVVMSYALYYIGQSFQSELPWTRCDPEWASGTECVVRSSNETLVPGAKTSTQVFWERKVLEISTGIEDLQGIKWDLAFCLVISWLIVVACLVKGVKTSGKVIYFAATFPYVILLSLLVAGLMQPGAWHGIKYFLYPDWSKLWSIRVWQAAASQMFFSLGVAMGGLIMYSSYNDFRHNIFHDAMIVSVLDTITSLVAGLVIFSVLGAMSHEFGVDLKQVVQGGPGLAFVAYPEALARLPFPQLWSVLFFLMLYVLGLDSEFAMLECVVTTLADECRFVRRHRLKFTVAFAAVFCGVGMLLVTRGGQFVFEILDYYGASIPLVFLAVAECVGLAWVYGFNKFSFDVYYMLDRDLGWYWWLTWKYSAPLILSFIALLSLYEHQPLVRGDYVFPNWCNVVGWCLTLAILAQVPLWAAYALWSQRKDSWRQRVRVAAEEADDWGPRDEVIRKDWRTKKTGLYGISVQREAGDKAATLKRFSFLPAFSVNRAFQADT